MGRPGHVTKSGRLSQLGQTGRSALLLTLAFGFWFAASAAPTTVGAEETNGGVSAEVVARVTDSVGLVRSAGANGSGWIAGPDTVITNLHVAKARSGDVFIDYSDGERVECYSAVADRDMDLAVLRCRTGIRRPISINTRVPTAGTPVAVVGYPGSIGPIETQGVITGDRIVARGIKTVRFTAGIQPGSSGSPVFDADGNVRAVATFSGGLGVPIQNLVPLLERAQDYPATKAGAEWRLRIRRSVIVALITLPLAWFFARRYGRNNPVTVAIRWTVFMVVLTLLITQLVFAAQGPASFI